ncbi:UNVERIFIED_CONTAM: hypothetical protein FKN15_021431 [Acipenser sinensis]
MDRLDSSGSFGLIQVDRGPCQVLERIGEGVYRGQLPPRGRKVVLHRDRLGPYLGRNPAQTDTVTPDSPLLPPADSPCPASPSPSTPVPDSPLPGSSTPLDSVSPSAVADGGSTPIDVKDALQRWMDQEKFAITLGHQRFKPVWRDTWFVLKYHSDALFDFPFWFGFSKRKFTIDGKVSHLTIKDKQERFAVEELFDACFCPAR